MSFLRGLARTILKPIVWIKEKIVDNAIDAIKDVVEEIK